MSPETKLAFFYFVAVIKFQISSLGNHDILDERLGIGFIGSDRCPYFLCFQLQVSNIIARQFIEISLMSCQKICLTLLHSLWIHNWITELFPFRLPYLLLTVLANMQVCFHFFIIFYLFFVVLFFSIKSKLLIYKFQGHERTKLPQRRDVLFTCTIDS